MGAIGNVMANLLSKILFRSVLVLTIGLIVVSCGRRGNLEAPPSSSAPVLVETVDQEPAEVESEDTQIKEDDKSFILDPLL